MNISIEKGKAADLDALARLYDDLNDSLDAGVNYPGWKKGVYPIRADAEKGVAEDSLYVAKSGGQLVGSVILNHEPEAAYGQVRWLVDADYADIFVVHTLAVDPSAQKNGVGRALLAFADSLGRRTFIKSIRLDVYKDNFPAIRLYEKCGYLYIGDADLGLGHYGLDSFRLYEKLL